MKYRVIYPECFSVGISVVLNRFKLKRDVLALLTLYRTFPAAQAPWRPLAASSTQPLVAPVTPRLQTRLKEVFPKIIILSLFSLSFRMYLNQLI